MLRLADDFLMAAISITKSKPTVIPFCVAITPCILQISKLVGKSQSVLSRTQVRDLSSDHGAQVMVTPVLCLAHISGDSLRKQGAAP